MLNKQIGLNNVDHRKHNTDVVTYAKINKNSK